MFRKDILSQNVFAPHTSHQIFHTEMANNSKTPSITPLYSNMGLQGLFFILLISALKHVLCVLVITASLRQLYEYPYMDCVYSRRSLRIPIHVLSVLEATLRIPIHGLCVLEAAFSNTHTCTECPRGGLYEYPYMDCVNSRRSL